ncbi:MAG: 16S rRNA (uracil(1498)-N(3))-methyltransferase [Bacteroidetes bacterium]|nr:16S rRNA (uracil(1498)-N(3))-methyltransferase [Bacteroidota bacterium]
MNIFIATIIENKAYLREDECHHCCKVLRYKSGDTLRVIDGNGKMYEGVLETATPKLCVIKIVAEIGKQVEDDRKLHIVIAPTKQIERIEWMIEKCVEVGVNAISFIQCKNSERTVLKHERLIKVIESAVKQSLRLYIPKLNPIIKFNDFIKTQNSGALYIAHCHHNFEKVEYKIALKNQANVTVLIGPEGDFTSDEIVSAQAASYKGISLGNSRLRTETAGLFACQAFKILND